MVQDRSQVVNPSPSQKALSVLTNVSTVSCVALSACLGFCVVLGATETQAQSSPYGAYYGDNGEGETDNEIGPDAEQAQLGTSTEPVSLVDLTTEEIYALINAITNTFPDEAFDDVRLWIQDNPNCWVVQEFNPRGTKNDGEKNFGGYIDAQCRRSRGSMVATSVLKLRIKDFILEYVTIEGVSDQGKREQLAEQVASELEAFIRGVIVGANENTDLIYLWELIYSPIK